MVIEWDDAYSIHNALIDAQHKKLFLLAKEAFFMLNQRVTPDELREILVEFFNYVKEHFHDEEEYMEKIGYPDLPAHKKIHREITNSLVTLVKGVKDVNDMKEKLHFIAKKWLLEHILKEDMKIERFRRNAIMGQQSAEKDNVNFCDISSAIYYYGCACSGRLHDVPPDVHRRIEKGEKFRCKTCKENIYLVKVQKVIQ